MRNRPTLTLVDGVHFCYCGYSGWSRGNRCLQCGAMAEPTFDDLLPNGGTVHLAAGEYEAPLNPSDNRITAEGKHTRMPSQVSLIEQLTELCRAANRLGLYDAADYLTNGVLADYERRSS